MGGKRKRLSAMVQIDIDSNQSKANRFNRYSILKSKKKEGQNNRPPILEAPGCHVQPLQSPLVIEMPSHEKFKTSNVNNEGAFQTVGVRRNLSGGLAQSSQCNFRIGSQIFSNEPTASSSTNPSDSVIDTAQCPTKFNGTDINVSDHPNITVGDEQLSQYIPPVSHIRRHYESHTFGGPNITCPFCGAKMWNEERVVVSPRVNYPVFSMCCKQGTIRLPLQHSTPAFLDQLFHPQSGSLYQHFKDNIRVYNSLFQFTSLGGKIDASINNGNGPYIFRLNGQTHHRLGSLLPLPGHNARYAQLYIYDTANEVSNRIYSVFGDTAVENINAVIVEGILGMLNEFNVIAKAFHMARDRYEEEGSTPWRLRLLSAREPNKKNYADPSGSEIAALIVGDIGVGNGDRDVIVEHRNDGLKTISVLHPLYMSMQYPLLFPHGEDGYVLGIPFVSSPVRENLKRKTVSMREYYAWKIQTRDLLHNTLLRGGRLFQQFLTDAFSATDEERLHYIKNNQKKLRADMYKDIRDAMHRGDMQGKSIGKRVILPASFTGSSRYLFQNYQDALAICRYYGLPDLFITFTCNANWSEIQEAIQILRGQKAEDRPDIVARVFKIKLAHLLDDLMKEAHFGKASAVTYTIEFQKRGLPHVHILLWLQPSAKFKTAADIDRFVSVEIPDPVNDPIGYEAVTSFMIHGHCGPVNYNASCMLDKKCTKFFPKSFQAQTLIDEHGYAVYRRRDTGGPNKQGQTIPDSSWHSSVHIRAFIVVRIVRLWKTILPPHNEFISIYFLAVDDQKNAMHGTIPSEYSADFEDHLMEGNVYKINMFQVTKRKQSHNAVPLQKILYLSSTTRIEQINDNLDKYPQHYFQFATMDDIIARTDREYFMTDVIGLLTSMTPISSIQISPKRISANITGQSSAKNLTANKRDIFIKLLSGDSLRISIWENFFIQLNIESLLQLQIKPIIVIAGTTIKSYMGEKFLATSSASKIYINLDIPETAELKERFQEETSTNRIDVKQRNWYGAF